MAFTTIPTGDVDAESPIDDNLTGLIKSNFDDHEARILLLKAYPLEWRVNGPLSFLSATSGRYRRLDGLRKISAQTLTAANFVIEKPGTSGTLEIDIRKHRRVNHLISSIVPVFSSAGTSVDQIAPALATQSIARATAQISTQSISLFKAAINVSSIILLGDDLVRYNLASAPDSDWKVGDSVQFQSCTSGANNVTVAIVRVNDDGGNNLVVTNASGVAQTGAAGNATLKAFAFNYTNPVSSEFVAGETVTMASHTTGANNGSKAIYAVNSGGNNIIVKDGSGVVQAGVAGTADVDRWVYSFSSAASATDFVVGEKALMASHTNAANDGNFFITAVNSGGNNVVVWNASGVAQGGVAGTVNTNRFIYSLSSDPTSSFSVGHNMVAADGAGANDGVYTVKQINRSGLNNLVVYNETGSGPSGGGNVYSARKIVSLAADYSSIYSLRSNIELVGLADADAEGFYDVLEINRGGGSNYNVVVEIALEKFVFLQQVSPAGRIETESKSVFSTRPKYVVPVTGENTYNNSYLQAQTTEAVIDGTDGTISSAEASVPVYLSLDIVSIPTGIPENLTVQIS